MWYDGPSFGGLARFIITTAIIHQLCGILATKDLVQVIERQR